ncbi:heptosyltransferase [Roseivirga sp. 4D4]|uniref:glycosyltransferase family 9 protein n=1 Tax=Roseivirga sp. 4D4 TaxID=1889784 RepID=UPI0008538DE0|nr:glycosyltransferase family 9 protein [Roseivirga sp. 4D4]OEK02072.1 heptosyltransferase [Roseivirga sp. 4D4]
MAIRQILVIQTAFIGDVILATGLLEKLHSKYPEAEIDFLVRKGNESLMNGHPFIRETIVWNKTGGKYRNLFKLIGKVRKTRYDLAVNVQRFANSGLITALSKAKLKIGFDKNPFSWAFDEKIPHEIGNGVHEVERNHDLIRKLTDSQYCKPKLYPSAQDFEAIKPWQGKPYICMAPASVWFTKQFPKEKWIELIKALAFQVNIFLLGAPLDKDLCNEIMEKSGHSNVQNLCGQLSLLQSTALMKDAEMNYVNDSAPMHLASAINAKTCAIFCSTIPEFGFGPLSDESHIVQVEEQLECRPCGLHGKKACPKGHFKCGFDISTKQLVSVLN